MEALKIELLRFPTSFDSYINLTVPRSKISS